MLRARCRYSWSAWGKVIQRRDERGIPHELNAPPSRDCTPRETIDRLSPLQFSRSLRRRARRIPSRSSYERPASHATSTPLQHSSLDDNPSGAHTECTLRTIFSCGTTRPKDRFAPFILPTSIMGRTSRIYLAGEATFLCRQCGNHLAVKESVMSTVS